MAYALAGLPQQMDGVSRFLSETTSTFPAMSEGWNITEDEHRRLRLILWLDERGGIPNIGEFYDMDPAKYDTARGDAETLESHGLVRNHFSMGGMAGLHVAVTGQLAAEAANLRKLQDNRRSRDWACRSAVVGWLDEVGATSESRPTDWRGFRQSRYRYFYGTEFSEADVARANEWLAQNGLIAGVEVAEVAGVVRPYLTGAGDDCAENHSADVQAWDRAQKGGAALAGNIFNINSGGGPVQAVSGDYAKLVQNIGSDAATLVAGLRGILETLQNLGFYDEPGLAAATAQADAAVAEVTSGTRTGAVEGFLTGVRNGVVANIQGKLSDGISTFIYLGAGSLLASYGYLFPH